MITPTDQQLLSILDQRLLIEDRTNQYIFISDMPSRFGFGYNSFLVGIKQNTFMPGSYLHIIYVDSIGREVPVTVTQYEQNKLIRCYFYCDEQYSVGFGKFMVCGTLVNDAYGTTIPTQWQNKINIKYMTNIYLNPYEKTPSVLRLKNRPTITLTLNQKQLYDYEITKSTETFTVSDVTIARPYSDYICLSLDTSSMSQSVYYEKYLNYALTDTISNVTNPNIIFSGSVTSLGVLSNVGQFNGDLLVQNTVPPWIMFQKANMVMYEGRLELGSVTQSQITKLVGYNISEFKISPDLTRPYRYPYGEYSIYLENVSEGINIPSIHLYDSESKIRPIQYVSQIVEAQKFSTTTTYFSGSVTSIAGQVYAEQFILHETGSPIYGIRKNPLIKSTDKFPIELLQSEKVYDRYSITHSVDEFKITTSGATVLSNCYITNSYLQSTQGTALTTFNYLRGTVYAKHLITKQEVGYSRSYFSGSLAGSGNFYVRTSGSVLQTADFTTSILDQDQYVQLQPTVTFRGEGYNANIQLEYLEGEIYSASYINTETYLHELYAGIEFKKMLLQSSNFQLQFKALEVLQASIPGGYTTYDSISVIIDTPASNSSVKLISETPFSIHESANNVIHAVGYFHLVDPLKDCTFTGYHQLSTGNYEIQKYELIDCQLSPVYESIFNTKQVFIKDNDYSKVYIPLALNLAKGYSAQQSAFIIQEMLSNSQSGTTVELTYHFRNELNQPKYVGTSDVLPMYAIVSDVQIYSGYFNSVEVLYNDNLAANNYQLLATIEFQKNTVFPVTKSIDLPAFGFSGQSTNLLFKPMDALGRYCPEDFFYTQYDVKIDAQSALDLQKTYNVTYLGGTTVGGSVTSVNNMTGDVFITALNTPFNNLVLPNVDLALNYLLVHGGGGTGSGGAALILNFSTSVLQYVIGTTRSDATAVTFSWVYSPAALAPTAQYFQLYYSLYPSQTNWVQIVTGSIPVGTNSLQIDSPVSTSLKLQVNYMDALNEVYTSSAYCYFRNYIACGVSSSVIYDDAFVDGLDSKSLAHNYNSRYNVSASVGQYIYFVCPTTMSVPLQPAFVVHHVQGGFTKSEVISYNNGHYIENYNIYRSYHNNLGDTVLTIESTYNPDDIIMSVGGSGSSGDYLPLSGGTLTGNLNTPTITVSSYVSSSTYYGDGSQLTGVSGITDHNSLSGLQGSASATEFYHLTYNEYGQLRTYFVSTDSPDNNSGSNGDIWITY